MYVPPFPNQGQWSGSTGGGFQQLDQIPGLMPSAAALYMQGLQQFPGETMAWANPLQEQGYGTALQGASAAIPQALQNQALAASLQGGFNAALEGANRWAGNPQYVQQIGASFDPLNPYLINQVRAANYELGREYAQNVMPRIDLAAVGAGQSGGSRHGVAQGIASQGLMDAMGRTTADMMSGGYEAGLNRYLQDRANTLNAMQGYGQLASSGWQMAPSMYNMMSGANMAVPQSLGYLGQTQQQIGGNYQNLMNAYLQDAQRRWNESQNAPWQALQNYAGIVYGAPVSGAGTQTSTGSTGGNWLTGAAGGALAGAGLYDWWNNNQVSPVAPPWGQRQSDWFQYMG